MDIIRFTAGTRAEALAGITDGDLRPARPK
jgi:hypothetical protein